MNEQLGLFINANHVTVCTCICNYWNQPSPITMPLHT